MRTFARVFAPASIANVAVGFDILGFSVDSLGDTVLVERLPKPEVVIAEIKGVVTALSVDPGLNTAGRGLQQLINDKNLKHGFRVSIEKGIPLGSGLGGSAASAVASVRAASELLETPLSDKEMIHYALLGEAVASGSYHADNIAPSLLGGLLLSRATGEASSASVTVTAEFERLPIPQDLWCVVLHQDLQVETKMARAILNPEIKLKLHVSQSFALAGFIKALYTSDYDLLARSLHDQIVEPQRAHLIPGFAAMQAGTLRAGALGCSIAGAGPSVFAWAKGEAHAIAIEEAMSKGSKLKHKSWRLALNSRGARVIS